MPKYTMFTVHWVSKVPPPPPPPHPSALQEGKCSLIVQGFIAQEKQPPPPQDHRRALGTVLLYGPVGALFFVSEVPL